MLYCHCNSVTLLLLSRPLQNGRRIDGVRRTSRPDQVLAAGDVAFAAGAVASSAYFLAGGTFSGPRRRHQASRDKQCLCCDRRLRPWSSRRASLRQSSKQPSPSSLAMVGPLHQQSSRSPGQAAHSAILGKASEAACCWATNPKAVGLSFPALAVACHGPQVGGFGFRGRGRALRYECNWRPLTEVRAALATMTTIILLLPLLLLLSLLHCYCYCYSYYYYYDDDDYYFCATTTTTTTTTTSRATRLT